MGLLSNQKLGGLITEHLGQMYIEEAEIGLDINALRLYNKPHDSIGDLERPGYRDGKYCQYQAGGGGHNDTAAVIVLQPNG
ncbi:MAG: hypothetical protein U5K69_15175 [Balneolaceae bacterium]|nr:hypothetical protein [Balneolaceae bacterium]